MKIVLSLHLTRDKLPLLKKHDLVITETIIRDIILHPEHLDKTTDKPRMIASKSISDTHILRVVYKKERGIITAITVYPSRKGRYY